MKTPSSDLIPSDPGALPLPLRADRADPPVPDYEVMGLIGSGAYGEVWLARGVTGALRAVKVIWREDFESDRVFEREFEGIRQFEPISREHPGLVDVLHVGRNDERGFYYHVMELADDALGRNEFTTLEYRPRTLLSEIKSRGHLPPVECCRHASLLADALHHLHRYQLAHRDVKPANVIFVDGVCKLADIGLVAATGQRVYVGTEGYVPPEGPGSEAADIYSLGKLLYEISTGRDRLDFPSLPEEFSTAQMLQWSRLNRIICKACAHQPGKRFRDARQMALALQRIEQRLSARPGITRLVLRTLWWALVTAAILHGIRRMGSLEVEIPRREIPSSMSIPAPDRLDFDRSRLNIDATNRSLFL